MRRTEELVNNPRIPAIFEATLKFENVLVRIDILERIAGDCWRLIEVKASTRTKDVHLDDHRRHRGLPQRPARARRRAPDPRADRLGHEPAGILRQRLDTLLEGIALMHLNRAYVYEGGEVALDRLFVQQDLTVAVLARLAEVPARRRLDAVRAVAEVHLVRVELEDLVLREVLLDVHGERLERAGAFVVDVVAVQQG